MSTLRYGVEQAPGGLSVVQDLLNTAKLPVAPAPDLLDDEAAAQAWVDAASTTWGERTGRTPPRIPLSGKDLPALRGFRDRLREWLAGETADGAPQPLAAEVVLSDGGLTYGPRGGGAAAVTSLVLLETLLASHTGSLSRLKTCRNPACGVAFYDLSRNSARVWHDMKTCGNVMNLRASRARKRGSAT